ncbi:GNAT family N-acetyltransferase [Lysinibacter cavernae]|uniref:Ribosomal-protein-alanine N-acetyltransferase n=1 Tax=Lysinibacter cavernae TaxID=1640652 RepID=A0A7X5R0D5_9MICO|nr:ribosomal-protein-alanine N-acetyltransferase [Lysinibacter cavernae]
MPSRASSIQLPVRTNRLLLRNWQPSDSAPFIAMGQDSQVMQFFPSVLSQAESQAFIDRQQSHITERGWGFWAIEHDGAFIGFTGLATVGFAAHFTPAVEIGWRLTPEAWGHGFATEAASAAIDIAFHSLGLDQVVSFTASQNTPSRAVMERLGMTNEPADNFDHPRLPEGHPLRAHVLYRARPAA